MEQRIITIYCLIDEYLKQIGKTDNKRAKISNTEIILMGYLAVSDFNGNYSKTHKYIMEMNLVNKIEYSRFIRRLNNLEKEIEGIFIFLSNLFHKLNETTIYSVDSFPVEICSIKREKKNRLINEPQLKGYNASKGKYFYGFKVHMVITTNKEPVCFYISDGSTHDITASYKYLYNLPENSIVIGDKGYLSSKLKQFLDDYSIHLSAIHKNNMAIDNLHKIKSKIRKGIETAFSVITAKFGQVIRATSISGFLVKLKLFITSYSIDMFLKL